MTAPSNMASLDPSGSETFNPFAIDRARKPRADARSPGAALKPMPNPTPADLEAPLFDAIWSVIKSWDVNVPEHYAGYCGASGSHAKLILDAIRETGAIAELKTGMTAVVTPQATHEHPRETAMQVLRESSERYARAMSERSKAMFSYLGPGQINEATSERLRALTCPDPKKEWADTHLGLEYALSAFSGRKVGKTEALRLMQQQGVKVFVDEASRFGPPRFMHANPAKLWLDDDGKPITPLAPQFTVVEHAGKHGLTVRLLYPPDSFSERLAAKTGEPRLGDNTAFDPCSCSRCVGLRGDRREAISLRLRTQDPAKVKDLGQTIAKQERALFDHPGWRFNRPKP